MATEAQQSRIVMWPVRVTSSFASGATSSGELQIKMLGTVDRVKRALKALALCWGLALFAVFIPGLHFILVPLLVLVGPLVAYRGYLPKRLVLGGQFTCPKCSAGMQVNPCIEHWPLDDVCTDCRSPLMLEPVDYASVR